MIDEDKFVDAEEYTFKQEKITFRDLMFRHLAKISEICTKEFRGGYWQNKPVKTGAGINMNPTYTPDTRDEYINSVNFLHDILLPHFDKEIKENKEDKNMKKDEKLINKRKLFQELNLLLKRRNYLASETLEE